jgi:hypothetical protein
LLCCLVDTRGDKHEEPVSGSIDSDENEGFFDKIKKKLFG